VVDDGHANPEEDLMIVDEKLMRYLTACMIAAKDSTSTVEWMEVCPECGDVPYTYDTDHLIVEVGDVPDAPENIMAVVVACEGYYTVDPAKLGLGDEHPNWMAPDAEVFIGGKVECTCGARSGWVHLPTCPAAIVGPVKG
jgi:hypothetical protein